MNLLPGRQKYVFRQHAKRLMIIKRILGIAAVVIFVIAPWQIILFMGYSHFTGLTQKNQTDANSAAPSPLLRGIPSVVNFPSNFPLRPQEYGIAAGGGLTYVGTKELTTYFQQLKDLGVTWVRWDLDWSQIQPSNASSFNWEVADRVVTVSQQFGISSLVIIDYTPTWARKAVCASEGEMCSPADSNTFATFAGLAAQRYKSQGIHYWEIWNEPNYSSSWGPTTSATDYAGLLKAAYTSIKGADPTATVLSGGLAAVGDDSGNISPLTFMKTLYGLNAQQYFDAVALHPYSYPALPSYKANWNRWQQIVPVHDLMAQHGDDGKKIWITEFGAPTGGGGVAHAAGPGSYTYEKDYMTEQAQSQIMTDALEQIKQYSTWMGPFFWYTYQDHTNSQAEPADFYGLVRADGSRRSTYDIYKKAASGS